MLNLKDIEKYRKNSKSSQYIKKFNILLQDVVLTSDNFQVLLPMATMSKDEKHHTLLCHSHDINEHDS